MGDRGGRRREALLIAALLLLLVVASCSSDSGGDTATTTPSTASSAESSTSTTLEVTSTTAPDLPGLDPSIALGSLDVPIALADGTTQDATFDLLEAGPDDGELVLLLHGYPQAAYEWREQLAALGAAGYHAVAFDQRGYSPGARPSADEDYAIALLAGDVVAVADALGAETFHVVGHDWGAAVAWVVAGLAADRVETLSAVSVPHPGAYSAALEDPDGEQSQKSGYITTFRDPATPERFTVDGGTGFLTAALGDAATPEEVAVYVDVLGTTDAMSAALAWYRANDLTSGSALRATTVPTLYVWSDGDCCLGRDAAEATADFVDGPYTYEVLDGISHWIPEEAPDELTAFLLDHLE